MAKEVREKLENLKAEVQGKKELMKHLTAAMKELENSNKAMQDLLAGIDDTAFQARLLGLNTSVEAAKTGEKGGSFAAAAEELRLLAKKIAELAKAVREVVSKNDKSFKKGMPLVKEASTLFTKIKKNLDKIV